MKTIAALILLSAATAGAQNPYEIAGRVLNPLVDIFLRESRTGNRALTTEITVIRDAMPAPEGTLHLAIAYPDKLRIEIAYKDRRMGLIRNGATLHAWPADELQPILAALPAQTGETHSLPLFQLPVPDSQAVLLPALLSVLDRGESSGLRVIDLRLNPEIAGSARLGPHASTVIRIWTDPSADFHPRRLRIKNPAWSGSALIHRLEFRPSLPGETWLPAADSMEIQPAQWNALLERVFP